MKRPARFVLAGALAAVGCGADVDRPIDRPTTISSKARDYLETLVGLMEAHSVNRRVIDWASFRDRVFAVAGTAQSISDTEGAILVALGLLGDGHSLFITAKGALLTNYPRGDCAQPAATAPRLPQGIGYVKVDGFEGSGTAATQFAQSIQDVISKADGLQLQGWIVDLRGNFGGNMWPMIAGIGPILGDGVCGYFIDPDGIEEAWEYSAGASLVGGFQQERVFRPYRLLRERPRVAVITGPTASSGEAVAVAFRGRAGTRSFGGPTCGQSTANMRYPMSDGAALYLTTSVMADRTKAKYGIAIPPDETLLDPAAVVERAVQWLLDPSNPSLFGQLRGPVSTAGASRAAPAPW